MARTKGSRNADYEEARARLVGAVRERVLGPGGVDASFRELAEVAGVSVATLRHYFGTREVLLEEVMKSMRKGGLPYLLAAATEHHGPVRESLTWFLTYLTQGWMQGVGKVHAFGLSVGFGHAALGPAYVQELLEPTLQSAEARLARHVADGELRRCDIRHAALELVSPVVLGLLHQVQLGGDRCRPLDVPRFLADHIDSFLRSYGAEPPAPAKAGGEEITLVRGRSAR